MDSGVVSGLLAALEAAYASHTPDRVRVEANQFLDAFKKDNPPLVVLNASMELLKRGVTTEVRYYGLHAFEYVVLKNWNTVTLEDRALIKQNILELMASPLNDVSTSSSKIIAVKLGVVASEIAKRDWPQLWPELLPALRQLASPSSTIPTTSTPAVISTSTTPNATSERNSFNPHGVHMALTVLSDIFSAGFQPSPSLPERRRKELQLGVTAHREELVGLIAQWLQVACETYGRNPRSLVSRALLHAALQSFSSIAENTPMELLRETGLLRALNDLLVAPDSAEEAHEILIALVCKKNSGWNEHPEEVLRLWDAVLRFAMQVVSPQTLQQIGEERQTGYLLKTSRALKVFLTTHTESALMNQRLLGLSVNSVGADAKDAQTAAVYPQMVAQVTRNTIQVLGQLLSSPSLQVATETYTCWIDVFRIRSEIFLRDREIHIPLVRELFQCVFRHIRTHRFEDHQMEFDDFTRFLRVSSSLKVQALALAQQLTLLQPVEMVRLLCDRTSQAFQALSQITQDSVFSKPSSSKSPASISDSSTLTPSLISSSGPTFDPTTNTIIAPYVYGSSAVDFEAFADAEACTTLLDHVMKTIESFISTPIATTSVESGSTNDSVFSMYTMPSHRDQTEVLSITEHLMSQLANFTHRELAFWTPKFRALAACVPLLITSPTTLSAFVSIALGQIQFNPNNCVFGGQQTISTSNLASTSTPTATPSTHVVQCPMVIEELRRRGAFTLLSLARRSPMAFGSSFPEIHGAIRDLFHRGVITEGEHIYLFEFLLTISLAVYSEREQEALVRELLSDSLQLIQSSGLSQALSSPTTFLSLAGCNEQEQALLATQLQHWEHHRTLSPSSVTIPIPLLRNDTPQRVLRAQIYFMLNKLSTVLRTFTVYNRPTPPQSAVFKAVSLPVAVKQQFLRSATASSSAVDLYSASPSSSSSSTMANPYASELPGGSEEPVHPVLTGLLPQILPFVRAIIRRINEATAESQIVNLPPIMHTLAAPSYSHMLWTLKHDLGLSTSIDGTGNATDVVPDRRRWLIRDVATWCEQTFEYACQILQAATEGGRAFYESVRRERDDWGALFASFGTAYPTRLRVFLTKFVHPFFLRCPVDLYSEVLLPFALGVSSLGLDLLGPSWISWQNQHSLPAALCVNSYSSALLRMRGLRRKAMLGVSMSEAPKLAAAALATVQNLANTIQMSGSTVSTPSLSQDEQELEILEDGDMIMLTQQVAKLLYPILEVTHHDQKVFDRTILSFSLSTSNSLSGTETNSTSFYSSPVSSSFVPGLLSNSLLRNNTVNTSSKTNTGSSNLHPIAISTGSSTHHTTTSTNTSSSSPRRALGCEFIVHTPSLRRCLLATACAILCFGDPVAGRFSAKAIRRVLPFLTEVPDSAAFHDVGEVMRTALRILCLSAQAGTGSTSTSGKISTSVTSPMLLDEPLMDELSFLVRDAFILLAPVCLVPQEVLRAQCGATEEQLASMMELLRSGDMTSRKGRSAFRNFLREMIETNMVTDVMAKKDDRKIVDLPPTISALLEKSREKKKNEFSYASAMNLFS